MITISCSQAVKDDINITKDSEFGEDSTIESSSPESKDFNKHISLDSSVYWVNTGYLRCIDNGSPICELQTEIAFVYIDTNNSFITKAHIHNSGPSVFELNIKKDSLTEAFLVTDSLTGWWGAFGERILIRDSTAILEDDNRKVTLKKIKVKNPVIEFSLDTNNYYEQTTYALSRLYYARSLLQYSRTEKLDTTDIIFTVEELSEYVEDFKIHMFCHLSGRKNTPSSNLFVMRVICDDRYFVIDYFDKYIILNEVMDELTPFEIDRSKITRKQIFYREDK